MWGSEVMKELLEKLKRNSKDRKHFGQIVRGSIKRNPELMDEIIEQTKFLDEYYDDILIGQRLYHIWTGEGILMCQFCGMKVRNISYNYGKFIKFNKYNDNCSKECSLSKMSISQVGEVRSEEIKKSKIKPTDMKKLLEELKGESRDKNHFGNRVKNAIIKHPELIKEIENQTQFLDEYYDEILFYQRVYHIWYGEKVQMCPICGERVLKRYIMKNKFRKYGVSCGDKECRVSKLKQTCLEKFGVVCALQTKEVKEKIKQTLKDKYGVDYISQSQEVREKIKQTNMVRYGVVCALQSYKIREKIKQTNMVRYGVEHASQSQEVREKIKQTNMVRYGVVCTLQTKEVIEKIKQTNMNLYGVEYISQSGEIKEKKKQTCMTNFGVEYPGQSEEIKEKTKRTCMNLYGVEYTLQSDEVREKSRQTCIKIYGVEYSSQAKEVREKMKQTNLERLGVEYASQSKEVRERGKQTCMIKFGFEYATQNPEILLKAQKSAYKIKYIPLPSGTIANVQGYEPFFIEEYFTQGLPESDLIHSNKPTFKYTMGDKNRVYNPDFLIQSENKIIEVKSKYTFECEYEQNLLKRQACLEAGYDFEFYIYDGKGNRLNTEQVIKDIEAKLYGKLA